MITFSDVSFQYGSRVILDGLSFTAEAGMCTVLAGPNGIGKSTALALAAGALKPHSGRITLRGTVGYCPQEAALFPDLSVRDNLKFFAGLRHAKLPDAPFLPLDSAGNKRVGKLSGGMQKRVSLVCADLGSPEILLLDEPCIGLDIAAQKLLFRQIEQWKAQDKCILYAGHNAAEIETVCDRLILLHTHESQILNRDEIQNFDATLREWIEAGDEKEC